MSDYYDTFTCHTYAGKRNLRIKIKRALRWLGVMAVTWYLIIWLVVQWTSN